MIFCKENKPFEYVKIITVGSLTNFLSHLSWCSRATPLDVPVLFIKLVVLRIKIVINNLNKNKTRFVESTFLFAFHRNKLG